MANARFAVITGCGCGSIGHALASRLRAQGFEVISTLLAHEDDAHLVEEGIHVTRTDVTNDQSVSELKQTVEKITGGRLDVLINNAGICYTMPATDTEASEVQKMFNVNVFGPMRVVHHLHTFLIAARGVIVNTGSIGGVTPYVYGASYNASKAALHHYGNTLRVELRPFGVRVVNVISGEVSTNILKNDHGRSLPEDSVYFPLNDAFREHLYRTPNGMKPEEYAAGVIREILKPSPAPWFWFGNASGIIRFIDAFLPRTTWDWIWWREFNLGKLVNAQSGKK